jgi:pyridoxamine 5'-phosphate oxidase family protein
LTSPVTEYQPTTGTIDIGGFTMAVRCLEIRGTAEAIEVPADSGYGTIDPIIRIHPRRILSFGLDQPDTEAHDLVADIRDVN